MIGDMERSDRRNLLLVRPGPSIDPYPGRMMAVFECAAGG